MLKRTILISASIAAIVAATFVGLGRQADRLEIMGDPFDRIELQVNAFTASNQSHISIDLDQGGNLVAVWDSRRQDNGTYGVFARWIGSDGRPIGSEEQVNVERRSMQERPVVAVDDGGEAWFAWQSFGQDGDLGSIICRGSGNERIVNEVSAGDQTDVTIDRIAADRWVAAWSTLDSKTKERRIATRLFDNAGMALSPERVIEAPPGTQDRLPAIAPLGSAGFAVTYGRSRTDNDRSQILVSRFNRQGESESPPIRVDEVDGVAVEPSIAASADGSFVIVWHEQNGQNDYDVKIRRFNPAGEAIAPPMLASEDASGWQSGAAVAMEPSGRFLVAWTTYRDGGLDSDVYARLFNSEGIAQSAEFRVNRRVEGNQCLDAATGAKRVVLGQDGRMAFAWSGDSGHGDATAANVTILIPRSEGIAGDLAAGLRNGRMWLDSWVAKDQEHLGAAAAPYVPPSFDATQRSELLDPNSLQVTEVGIGFTAFTNTGWTPPDPHMAAGPNHVMGMVNGGIVAYQKDGTLVWIDDISGGGGFWGEVGATSFVFDPEVMFDPYENRFIAMANERGSDNHSYFLVGICSSDDPSDPWYKYRLDVTALAGNDIDSPNIAVDRDAIYLTADFFTGGQKYLVYIIDKASIINGGAPVTTSYLRVGSQSFGIPVMYTDDAPNMYMIEHFEADPSNTVRLWAILDPLGTPSLTSFTLSVPQYYRPGNLKSLGTTARPIAFDSRFWSCMYRDGSLWAAHHVAHTNSPRTTVARWYEIEMNGWPVSGNDPTLRQSGTVEPPNDVYCSFNSICADQFGNALMVFARSSVNEYLSISRVFRVSSDPLGTMSSPEFVKESGVVYTRDRWGDYSAVAPDPADPGTFWMHHEYAAAGNNWHTWIASEQIVDPAAVIPGFESGLRGLDVSPNPTTRKTTLSFDLAKAADVSIEIFSVEGRLVRRDDMGYLTGRAQQISWDGRDQSGTPVGNGIYLARVVAGGETVGAGRIVITK